MWEALNHQWKNDSIFFICESPTMLPSRPAFIELRDLQLKTDIRAYGPNDIYQTHLAPLNRVTPPITYLIVWCQSLPG